MNNITYTFPANCKIAELRGVTCTGGVLIRHNGADAVQFANQVQGRGVLALVAGKPELEAAVAAYRADEQARKAQAAKAAAEYARTPRGERQALAEAEYNSYSADAFPGSARWLANKRAADALAAFDAAHPDLVEELEAARAAAETAAYDRLSDFVKNGS